MSYSKRLLFENHPADNAARAQLQADIGRRIDQFPAKVPTRRKNRLPTSARWDPLWEGCLDAAARELSIETIRVNEQVCTRTDAEAARLKAHAETLWAKELIEFRQRYGLSSYQQHLHRSTQIRCRLPLLSSTPTSPEVASTG